MPETEMGLSVFVCKGFGLRVGSESVFVVDGE